MHRGQEQPHKEEHGEEDEQRRRQRRQACGQAEEEQLDEDDEVPRVRIFVEEVAGCNESYGQLAAYNGLYRRNAEATI